MADSLSRTQSFVIHRHGARYPLKQPTHNVLWPNEKSFWNSHLGRLTPVGVIQVSQLGTFFANRYPWIGPDSTNIWSTHRSRALESAWAFTLGLLPDHPTKFNCIRRNLCSPVDLSDRSNETNEMDEDVDTRTTICCINYYHKRQDPLFGHEDPSRMYKLNINESELLKGYVNRKDISEMVERLSKNGHFRVRRDDITTIAKLKEIYSQIQVDSQLRIPHSESLASHYGLTESELELINKIGCEVMHRRLIPSTDLVTDDMFNRDQGLGLITDICDKMKAWDGQNELNVYSCHDTNMIAMMSVLGIKISPPSFTGYILIERTRLGDDDRVIVYYCPIPFDLSGEVEAKVWDPVGKRKQFLDWDSLSSGAFQTDYFIDSILCTRLSIDTPMVDPSGTSK